MGFACKGSSWPQEEKIIKVGISLWFGCVVVVVVFGGGDVAEVGIGGLGGWWGWAALAWVDLRRLGVISQLGRQLPVQLLLMVPWQWPPARTFIVFRCKSICCRILLVSFSSPDGIEENTSTNNSFRGSWYLLDYKDWHYQKLGKAFGARKTPSHGQFTRCMWSG